MKKPVRSRFTISLDILAVCLVTIYLAVYCTLIQFDASRNYGLMMLLCSPVFIVWMVVTVLKYGKYKGRELGDDEFGYQDKSKDELGVL